MLTNNGKSPGRAVRMIARNVRKAPHVCAGPFRGELRAICAKDYSYRRAIMGSTRMARRAGM
jgi:hypothetical protein